MDFELKDFVEETGNHLAVVGFTAILLMGDFWGLMGVVGGWKLFLGGIFYVVGGRSAWIAIVTFAAFRFCPDNGQADDLPPQQPRREPPQEPPQRENPRPVRFNARVNGQQQKSFVFPQTFKDRIMGGELKQVTPTSLGRVGINRTNQSGEFRSDAHLAIYLMRQRGWIDAEGNWTDSGLAEFSPPHSQEWAFA